jgi:hypothetical protein
MLEGLWIAIGVAILIGLIPGTVAVLYAVFVAKCDVAKIEAMTIRIEKLGERYDKV